MSPQICDASELNPQPLSKMTGSPFQEAPQGSVRTEGAWGKFWKHFKGRQQDLPIDQVWAKSRDLAAETRGPGLRQGTKVPAGPGGSGRSQEGAWGWQEGRRWGEDAGRDQDLRVLGRDLRPASDTPSPRLGKSCRPLLHPGLCHESCICRLQTRFPTFGLDRLLKQLKIRKKCL